MAKKRITDITVERTALLATDYIAGDSTSGTNNTAKISFPNLLAQLSGGPTTPTFQIKLSTLATAGLGGVSRLARGFDIFGTNPKATTAAAEYLFQVASNDAATPLALRFGVTTHATAGSRNGIIEVDDAGTKRNLILQPSSFSQPVGGNVGIGGAAASNLLTLTKLSSSEITATGIDFFSNVTISGNPFNSGRIYAKFDGAGYSDARLTIASPTGVGTFVDVLNIKNGNVGIGQTTFGAGAVKVMAFGNGTIPGTIADGFQLVSADVVAGQAAPHFVIENGPVIRLYQQAHIPDADGSLGSVNSQLNLLLAAVRNTRLLAAA